MRVSNVERGLVVDRPASRMDMTRPAWEPVDLASSSLEAFPGTPPSGLDCPLKLSHGTRAQPKIMERLEVEEKLVTARRKATLYPYVKRFLDSVLAGVLLIVLAPVMVVVAVRLHLRGTGRIVERRTVVGWRDCRFSEYSFATSRRLVRRFPLLFNILKGHMSFIGPQAWSAEDWAERCQHEPFVVQRTSVRPGILCDWWIRRCVSLDYVSETHLDVQYVENLSFRKDFCTVLRAIPGLLTLVIFGDDPPEYTPHISISNVRIDNLSMESAIDTIISRLDGAGVSQGCFINPHNINQAYRFSEYMKVLEEADLVLADGFGTKLAGKVLDRPIRQNLCGTDLFPRLCKRLAERGKSIYLLGAAPGAAERTAKWVMTHYPGVAVKGWHHGFFTPDEESEVVRRIAESGADILIVGMGVPKQDVWIRRNLQGLNVKMAIGFGGLFDYFSGQVPRAPQWVREIGMEWVYRLIQEPGRMWRRYLIGNCLFMARVCRERFFGAPVIARRGHVERG